jgi:Phosphoribosylanthranilate isomerase
MKVKICGVTHPDDAWEAAKAGADYVGMIFAKDSQRCVTKETAKCIVEAIRDGGSEPVGVFSEHSIGEIIAISSATGITSIQLSGRNIDFKFSQLRELFSIFYVVSVYSNGQPSAAIPPMSNTVTVIYDHIGGERGEPFDWRAFSPFQHDNWMLGGGVNPGNVGEAVRLLSPRGIDVSSGVERPGVLRKDVTLMQALIDSAKGVGNLIS